MKNNYSICIGKFWREEHKGRVFENFSKINLKYVASHWKFKNMYDETCFAYLEGDYQCLLIDL